MHLRPPRAVFVGDEDDNDCGITAGEVIDEAQPEWLDTGLLNARGEPIYRRRPTVKMGFVP
jgi:hypothetical protein